LDGVGKKKKFGAQKFGGGPLGSPNIIMGPQRGREPQAHGPKKNFFPFMEGFGSKLSDLDEVVERYEGPAVEAPEETPHVSALWTNMWVRPYCIYGNDFKIIKSPKGTIIFVSVNDLDNVVDEGYVYGLLKGQYGQRRKAWEEAYHEELRRRANKGIDFERQRRERDERRLLEERALKRQQQELEALKTQNKSRKYKYSSKEK